MDHEKALPHDEKAIHHPSPTPDADQGEWREQEDFMTRNGLNLKSFQRRPHTGPMVVLDKSMKTRHLHMIAIGGSIGAGFFVGSGGALNKGVRRTYFYFDLVICSHSPGSSLASHRFLAYGNHDLQRRLRSW